MNEKISATFPILLILFGFMVLLAIPFVFYFKNVRIKDSTARKIEIIGYYILFVVIIWEFGMKNLLMRDFNNLDTYILEEKMNIFFLWVINAFNKMDISNLISEYYDVGTNNQYVEFQLLVVDVIEMILQILSTIFIAIGRFQELISKTNKQNE